MTSNTLHCARLGVTAYEDALELQRRLAEARSAGRIGDLLLLLEHNPVYTRGRRSQPSELPMGEDWYRMQGIEVCVTDRGGLATYHGPGQLVGYPIVSLKPRGDDVHAYVRDLERVMIGALAEAGIKAGCIAGLTGVWALSAADGATKRRGAEFPDDATAESVAELIGEGSMRKIGSIGVHVRSGVTTHGFAINVNNDLQPFEWIVPCGIEGCRMTSVGRELGGEQDFGVFAETVLERFAEVYGAEPMRTSGDELAERAGIDPGVLRGATLGTR